MPAIPNKKPKSPTRFTKKAFKFADIAEALECQNPINK